MEWKTERHTHRVAEGSCAGGAGRSESITLREKTAARGEWEGESKGKATKGELGCSFSVLPERTHP